ncbi:MAG TPA: response regulator [Terriglobia bacterium]|nr:response regulator [Terriglobia bacterium]
MQAGLKILVVDDNPTILKLICKSLEKAGELITATDGADALMKAIELKPDLIISDYSMPMMDGRALFEKLRARKETEDIPFVFVASRKEIDERLRMVVDGVEDYFVKPFFVRELTIQARRITARLHQQKMEQMGARGGAITGSLTEMSLLDWMSSLEQGRKTCALVLRNGKDLCTLYFTEGQVTHATYGDLKGDPAVFKVLTWTEGEWALDFSKTASEQTTTMSTQGLMMEGLRILDEANRDAG